MAHDVFISHSTEDKPAADAVCAILEKNGVRCWIAPRDIMPGSDWGESIVNAIRTSRVLLLLFSTNANKSRQIKREVEIAADGNVTIVPVRIENILPTDSFKYFLGNIHWLDALTPPLEKHLEGVAAKVKGILSTESVTASEVHHPPLPPKPLARPAYRNVLPVIGGTLGVMIFTLAILFFWQSRPPSIGINGKVANPSGSPVQVVSTPPFAPPSPVPSGLSNQTVAISSASMAPVVNLAGRWQITQSNGSVVDVSMKQEGDRLSAFCTHSNGSVRSTDASGTVRGDSMILTITWDDGTKGEYTGRLETGHFARINEGILKGTTRDLFHPTSTATWEVMDRVFLRP